MFGKELQDHPFQPPAWPTKSHQQACPLIPHIIHPLNIPRDEDVTISLGNPFQCLTTLSMKKSVLINNLIPPWHISRPYLLSPEKSRENSVMMKVKLAWIFLSPGNYAILCPLCRILYPWRSSCLSCILPLTLEALDHPWNILSLQARSSGRCSREQAHEALLHIGVLLHPRYPVWGQIIHTFFALF